MTRTRLLSALAALAVLASCRAHPKPNVLIITIDTLRADHLGCYGFASAHTPNIDQLASESVRFSDDITSAPITMPAHTSIFTGLFPPAHGVRDNGTFALGEGAVTLAERLKGAGYTTHAFVSALVLNRRYNLNQGFETYDDDLWAEDEPKLFMIRERPALKTADRFFGWLDGWKKDRSRPFFTWIHFFDPHQPYNASATDVALAGSPYDGEITGVDRQIGRIIATLRRDGLLDNTILVLTADHGESLGEHGEKTHAVFVYDATVHVPLLIRYPRYLRASVYAGPVRSVDIAPTILDILRIGGKESMDGRSLLTPLEGKEAVPSLPQYSESLLSEVGFGMAPLYAIRNGQYKFIRAPRPELYDLHADPKELRNLFDQQPRIAARLNGQLTEIMNRSTHHAVKASVSPMNRETEESLQALGYLAPHGERDSMQGIDPKDGLPLHNKLEDARHLAQQGKWEQSQKLLLELVAQTPTNVSAINVLGLVAIKQGDRPGAVVWYTKSLAIDPTQFRIYGVLGSLALSSGDLKTASQDFQKCLEINPHYAEAMANIGFVEELQGHQQLAAQWYQKGIALDPTFPRVYRRLGDLSYERNDFASAYKYYQKTVQLVPSDLRALLQEGTCARRLGRASEAEALFRKAESLRPDGWIPTYNRACLLATTNRAPQALQMLIALENHHNLPVQMVESDPDLAEVRKLPGYEYLRQQLETSSGDDEEEQDSDG